MYIERERERNVFHVVRGKIRIGEVNDTIYEKREKLIGYEFSP
jgi:hypothetical protein